MRFDRAGKFTEQLEACVIHMGYQNRTPATQNESANIRQNINIALSLKGILHVTMPLGISLLWQAVLEDTGATVLVTANALRLLLCRGK